MNPFLESAMKVSVIIALTLAAAILLKRRSAALRHWTIAVGVTCAAAAPVLAPMLPGWHAPLDLSRPIERAEAPPNSGAVQGVVSPASPLKPVADATAPTTHRGASLIRIVGTTWIAGAALSFVVLFIGLARLSWLASRARPVVGGHWAALSDQISLLYGLRRRVLVLQSDHPNLLVTWGFARPVVILPQVARDWSEDRARIVLLHELAHIRRGDWIAQMVAELLRSVYWFNPLMWMACRRLRDESERACDDAVINRGIDGSDYAAELLELARTLNTRGERWFPAPAMARASSLEGRVAAMLNTQISRGPVGPSARLTAAATLIVLALGVAGFSASAQTFSSVSGSVVDQLGGAIPGVTLALTNRDTGQKYEVHSNPVGSFEFVGLTSGEYDLDTQMPGFRSAQSRITVSGRNLRQDVQLGVGSLEETINVVDRGEPRSADEPQKPQVRRGPTPEPKACVSSPSGGRIAQPRKIADARPRYPDSLRGTKVTAELVFDAVIGTDGSVKEVRPIDPNVQPDLANAAMEAVRLWQYTPTLLNCVPIDVSMKVHVNFKVE